jgi:hypothetical protein
MEALPRVIRSDGENVLPGIAPHDLIRNGDLDGGNADAFEQRRDAAEILARRLREAIEADRPVQLKAGEVTAGPDGDALA